MKINTDYLRKAIRPRWGRMSESQLQYLAENLNPPAWFAWGPFIVLIDLPERFQKHDEDPPIEAVNEFLRQLQEQLQAGFGGFQGHTPS